MEIKIHQAKDSIKKYFGLVKKFYRQHAAFEYYNSDLHRAVDFCFTGSSRKVFCIEALSNDETLGHIALITDVNIPSHQAYFGFFECGNDNTIFNRLWQELIALARDKQIRLLLGPVNGSIWYPYRVISMSSSENFFPSEPLTQEYYYQWFKKLKPKTEIVYHSAYRIHYDAIIGHTENSYADALNSGISIERGSQITPALMQQIFLLSAEVFNQNWGYTPLNHDDFISLYSSDKLDNYLGSLYLVKRDNKLIGFCNNFKYNNTMIMKTIALDPAYQKLGIGNALVHKVHADAVKSNIEKIIYALVRKENNIKYFPTDDVKVFREYSAFEYDV